ncbi:MAG TPA: hypothetical protein VNL70_10915 [Tepidisphaeraceae bacterium]|nr:hypothetical protein [Tepidisphaeraceae bacterium]
MKVSIKGAAGFSSRILPRATTQQKVLLGIVLVGLCALGIDRFVVGYASDTAPHPMAAAAGDQPARSEYAVTSRKSATSDGVSPVAAAGSAAAHNTPANEAKAELPSSIADRLRQVFSACDGDLSGQSPDAFAFSAAWDLQPPATPDALETGPSPADNFRRTHRLIGVVVSGDRSCAVLDGGRIIPLGQMLDGFRLIQVQHRAVTFASASQSVTLSLTERQQAPLAAANP